MDKDIALLRRTRHNVLNLIEDLSVDQMTRIPEGMNNHILWNVGHCLVTQQLLCYKFSGLPMGVDDECVEQFRKGTGPRDWTNQPDIDSIRDLMLTSVDRLEEDVRDGIFKEYQSYKTSYGVTIASIEDAVRFNNLHEALHLGVIMAQRHLVQN